MVQPLRQTKTGYKLKSVKLSKCQQLNILSSLCDVFKCIKYLKKPISLSKMTRLNPPKINFCRLHHFATVMSTHKRYPAPLQVLIRVCVCKNRHVLVRASPSPPHAYTNPSRLDRTVVGLESSWRRESWVQLVRCKCFLFVLAVASVGTLRQCFSAWREANYFA